MSANRLLFSAEDTERVLATMFFLPHELEMLKQNSEFFGSLERVKTAEEAVELIKQGEQILQAQKAAS